MTSMILPSPGLNLMPRMPAQLRRNSLAAGAALALHGGVLAVLMHTWSVSPPAPTAPAVLHTQLVMLPPAPTPPVAEPLLTEPVPAPAVVAPPPEPVKPRVDPQIQAQKLEQAALARKRVEEKKREQQAEQQRQREAQDQRQREAEQQQLAQQQAQQQAQRAEQARAAAERSRQQALADSRQYLPLSKQAPDYPQRALDKNLEGDCSVEYTVNPLGKVENPRVLDGCHPLFIRPSLAAANTFRYQPRIIDGQAVAVPAVRNTFHYRIK